MMNIELLDPILEAMLDSALLQGSSGNVSVEFNFIPFLVDESDHHWHPGPMDCIDDGEEKEEDDEGEFLYGDNDDYGEAVEDLGDTEENNRYDYSSYHEHDEAEEGEGDVGEEVDDEDIENENEYDEGDEELEDDDEDEYDDDDDLRLGFIDDSVLTNYGSLGWSICYNISDRKLLRDTFNSRDFLGQMVEFFFTHLKQPTTVSTSALQSLLACLPTLVELKKLITKRRYTMEEALVIKVVLELYENYHKTFGAPNFKVYHTDVIPVLLDFYKTLPDAILKLMSKQLTRVLVNHQNLTKYFNFYQTRQEFTAYYRESTRRMRNLSECTNPALFLR